MVGTLLLLVLLGQSPQQPAAATGSPEGAAMAFALAVRTSNWRAASRLMHPAALKQLRTLFAPIVGAPGMEAFGQQLFGTNSPAAFASLPDTVLFARFLENSIGKEAGMKEVLSTAKISVLGQVAQGPDTVLVVTRNELSVKGAAIRQFEVMPLVRFNGQWRAWLKADFTNMAAMLRQAIGKSA